MIDTAREALSASAAKRCLEKNRYVMMDYRNGSVINTQNIDAPVPTRRAYPAGFPEPGTRFLRVSGDTKIKCVKIFIHNNCNRTQIHLQKLNLNTVRHSGVLWHLALTTHYLK